MFRWYIYFFFGEILQYVCTALCEKDFRFHEKELGVKVCLKRVLVFDSIRNLLKGKFRS